ncbi:MAG: protein kinase [Myxococcota bacterium]
MGAGVEIGVGEVVADRYRVERIIGEGGMGTVYEATDLTTRRRRALKVMQAAVVANPDLRARFEREAKVAAEVRSDHIAEVFDAGVDTERGLPFIALELLEGKELGDMIEPARRLPPSEVVTYLGQAASALDRAHAVGIVHRDIKPENLFVTRRDDGSPRVKLLDFGIAKVTEATNAGPKTRGMLGTPLYMAPEQMHGEHEIGPAADTYALAHIAYRLLVGEAFWGREQDNAETMFRFLTGVMKGTAETATARARTRAGVTLPAAFDAWFARATASVPNDRFASAGALIAHLGMIYDVPIPRVIAGAAGEGRSTPPAATQPGAPAAIGPSASAATQPGVPATTTSPGGPAAGARPAGSTLAQAPLLAASPAPVASPGLAPPEPTPAPAWGAPTPGGGSLDGRAVTVPEAEDVVATSRRPVAAIAAVGLVALAGVVAFGLTRSSSDEEDVRRKPAAAASSGRDDDDDEPRSSAASGPSSSSPSSSPPSPDLSGTWVTPSGRAFTATWKERAYHFIIDDLTEYARQNYQRGEPRFVLVPDGDAFRVEEHVRALPPHGTEYAAGSVSSCVYVAWSDHQGNPLRARLDGSKLQVQHLKFQPTEEHFESANGKVTRCRDFGDVETDVLETKLERQG